MYDCNKLNDANVLVGQSICCRCRRRCNRMSPCKKNYILNSSSNYAYRREENIVNASCLCIYVYITPIFVQLFTLTRSCKSIAYSRFTHKNGSISSNGSKMRTAATITHEKRIAMHIAYYTQSVVISELYFILFCFYIEIV